MTNQYKAASELQSCIVPTDFRILCRNWPSAAAGRGWRMGSPVPPARKHWAVQTQSWSLSGQQDPGCRCPEGPVYSNNSTRPPLSEQRQGARLGLESPGSFHLCLISQAARDGEVGEGMFLEPSLGLQISRLGSDALTAQAQGLLHWLFEHQPLRLSLSSLL